MNKSDLKFSLVVPIWNEGGNTAELVKQIIRHDLPSTGMEELVLVNNGSTDGTNAIIDSLASKYRWITPLHLSSNLNYGGGIYEGILVSKSQIICYIPGDLQTDPSDVLCIYRAYLENSKEGPLLVKGLRTTRKDPKMIQDISRVYTYIANLVLNLKVADVNGLPKLFNKELISLLPKQRMKTFVFDAQLIYTARINGWRILEVPVAFNSRREGISSWSGKRMQVYIRTFFQLIQLWHHRK